MFLGVEYLVRGHECDYVSSVHPSRYHSSPFSFLLWMPVSWIMWTDQQAPLPSASHCVWPMKGTNRKLERGRKVGSEYLFPQIALWGIAAGWLGRPSKGHRCLLTALCPRFQWPMFQWLFPQLSPTGLRVVRSTNPSSWGCTVPCAFPVPCP